MFETLFKATHTLKGGVESASTHATQAIALSSGLMANGDHDGNEPVLLALPGPKGDTGATGAAGVGGGQTIVSMFEDAIEGNENLGLSTPANLALYCSAFNSTTQSVVSGAFVVLTLDSETYDVGGFHDLVTNTSRLTVPAGGAGVYLVLGKARIAATATTNPAIAVSQNGTIIAINALTPSANASDCETLAVVLAAAGDYFELLGFHNSGVNANFGSPATSAASRLIAFRLVPL